jgi:hypothetical protein
MRPPPQPHARSPMRCSGYKDRQAIDHTTSGNSECVLRVGDCACVRWLGGIDCRGRARLRALVLLSAHAAHDVSHRSRVPAGVACGDLWPERARLVVPGAVGTGEAAPRQLRGAPAPAGEAHPPGAAQFVPPRVQAIGGRSTESAARSLKGVVSRSRTAGCHHCPRAAHNIQPPRSAARECVPGLGIRGLRTVAESTLLKWPFCTVLGPWAWSACHS